MQFCMVSGDFILTQNCWHLPLLMHKYDFLNEQLEFGERGEFALFCIYLIVFT